MMDVLMCLKEAVAEQLLKEDIPGLKMFSHVAEAVEELRIQGTILQLFLF